jgi:protein-S-isoprenylcysteine O-methyltransferase Ste14
MPLVVNAATMMVFLFGSVGRFDWPNGWVLIGLSALTGAAAERVLARNPGLAAERRNGKAGKKWDRALVGLVVLLGPVATWITAGLEVRHGAAPAWPLWLAAAGGIAAILGGALLVWAMHANAYFSAVVRIQKDRGHSVVSTGPYRWVRHPGYAGMSAFMLATPLILASRWAFVPAALTVVLSLLRTVLEDRTLHEELAGYVEYARAVRYRWLPGLW